MKAVELRQGLAAITRYLTAHQLPPARTLLRLDGLYGTGAVCAGEIPSAPTQREYGLDKLEKV
jgi:hypothetical protein